MRTIAIAFLGSFDLGMLTYDLFQFRNLAVAMGWF